MSEAPYQPTTDIDVAERPPLNLVEYEEWALIQYKTKTLDALIADPPDPGIGMYGVAQREILEDESHKFTGVLKTLLGERKTSNTLSGIDHTTQITYLGNLAARALTYCALMPEWGNYHGSFAFPDELPRDDPEPYKQIIEYVVETPSVLIAFANAIMHYNISSNVSQRYAIVPMIINTLRLAQGRFKDDPSIWDAGSSLNLGLLQIGNNIPFQKVNVYRNIGSSEVLDEQLTEMFNAVMNHGLNIGQSYGSDVTYPDSDDIRQWCYACSSYPYKEMRDKDRMERFKRIFNLKTAPNVGFVNWDYLEEPDFDKLGVMPASADLMIESHSLYQHGDVSNVRKALNNMRQLLSNNGVLATLEFIDTDAKSKSMVPPFSRNPHAKPYTNTLTVIDYSKKYPEPQRWIYFMGGRCTDAKLSPYFESLLRTAYANLKSANETSELRIFQAQRSV
jgi:hypothetical protein